MDQLPDTPLKPLAKAPTLGKMIGPSLILLGLGLGSGEIILWPYLTANFGLGIIWAALLGLTLQFFLNMEVERYALVKGESVFVGFARLWRWLPIWFILSTFIGFGWPGIVAAAAKILAEAWHIARFDWLAIGLLIFIGLILSFGPKLYKTLETYQKVAISIGIPIILYLTIRTTAAPEWVDLARGVIGQGDGYQFIPLGLPLFTFLGALAYAGAGGNLNLAQSFYIKDKGYGMGKYGSQITNILKGKEEQMHLTGATFAENQANLKKFRRWWKLMNLEHGLVFWGLGLFTISMLALLSYSTTYGLAGNATGINFIVNESQTIGRTLGASFSWLFLVTAGVLLFGTQLTVMDSTSRIITENVALAHYQPATISRIPIIYYTVLWLQILFGIIVFLVGFTEPKTLVVIGSVINAVAMFFGFGLIILLNYKKLPRAVQPVWWRRGIMLFALIFFGYFATQAFLNAKF